MERGQAAFKQVITSMMETQIASQRQPTKFLGQTVAVS